MAILRVEPVRRIFVDADPTSTAVPGVAMPGDVINYAGTDYVMTSGGVVAEASRDSSPVFESYSIAGAGAALSNSVLVKNVTAIADNTATAVLTVSIPNAAHAASLRVRLVGSLGAGGAIGAREATGTVAYDIAIARTAGVNAVVTASSAYGSGMANVAGAATITVTAAASAISGAVGAVNTFTVAVTINSGSGSSANHNCMVIAELANVVASGVTMA
jgi:hypothetical protein